MFFSLLDLVVALAGIGAWFAVVDPSLVGISPTVAVGPFAAAAVGISTSHVLYALVWFNSDRFAAVCRSAKQSPVEVFGLLVLLAKCIQQGSLLLWLASVAISPFTAVMEAESSHWVLAAVLMGLGQTLNAAIYAAIGKDGVYYGFKLGAPVPWCDGFPFNLGFRHPQYVGGYLTQLGVIAMVASPAALASGLVPLGAWWFFLYAVTSWMEASGDNDTEDAKAK
jgi:hypothetical protein